MLELTGDCFKCIELIVLEQRWTVICNVYYYNQRKEKSLAGIRSWRFCSLNHPSKLCVEFILFPGSKVSTWSFWGWTSSSVCVTRSGQGWSTKRPGGWIYFFHPFFFFFSRGYLRDPKLSVEVWLWISLEEWLWISEWEFKIQEQEVGKTNHRWIRQRLDWLSGRK